MKKLPKHAQTIFDEVREVTPSARSAAIQRLCKDDKPLRSAVERLIAAYEEAGSLLEAPLGADDLTPGIGLNRGDKCGSYRILELIGDGGFGQVFAAEQLEPVSRKVALKLIKPGMDSAQVLARFETERQALAMLDHTNIARFFEAGSSERGYPFFVMELVPGTSISNYCKENTLSVRRRVELLASVCDAVHHAHQKGIIHRDLKPSNILVEFRNGAAHPKVIDFGVAKAVGGSLSRFAAHTQKREVIGTPLYMSPEQARLSRDVDTRTDVFSLGVILYELLTNTTPIERDSCDGVDSDDIRRMIQELEPPLPSRRIAASTNVDETSATFDMQPRKLIQSVRGDLDWIVAKALSKDRQHRYGSADDFGRDLRRWLQHQPVEARAPSKSYLVYRFLQRNRAACLTAAAIVLVLLATTIFSIRQAHVAATATQYYQAVADHLAGTMLSTLPTEKGFDVPFMEVASAEAGVIEEAPDEVQAFLHGLYGEVFRNVGEHMRAIPHLEKAVSLNQGHARANTTAGFKARSLLALLYRIAKKRDEASAMAQQLIKDAARAGKTGIPFVIEAELILSVVDSNDNQVSRAMERASRARELAKSNSLPAYELAALRRLNDLHKGSALDKAAEYANEGLRISNQLADVGSFDALDTATWVARTWSKLRKYEEIVGLLEPRLEQARARLKPDHYLIVKALCYLGDAYNKIEARRSDALATLDEAYALAQTPRFQDDYPDTFRECVHILTQNRPGDERNITLLRNLVRHSRDTLPKGNFRISGDQFRLARVLLGFGKLDEARQHAEAVVQDLLPIAERRDEAHRAALLLAQLLNRQGESAGVVELLGACIPTAHEAIEPLMEMEMAIALVRTHSIAAGRERADRALAKLKTHYRSRPRSLYKLVVQLSQSLAEQGLFREAAAYYESLLDILEPDSGTRLRVQASLAHLFVQRVRQQGLPLTAAQHEEVHGMAEQLETGHQQVSAGALSNSIAEALSELYTLLNDADAAEAWKSRTTPVPTDVE